MKKTTFAVMVMVIVALGVSLSVTYSQLATVRTILNNVWDKANHRLMVTDNAGAVQGFENEVVIFNDVWDQANHKLRTSGSGGGGGASAWGDITGTLSNQTDLQSALDAKQASLGFTAEDVANKSTNTSLGTSDTLYSSQKAVKSYVDTGLAAKQGTLTNSAGLRAALSDETGTGVAYFQGGDLGTPSAGVGTNFTGTAAGLTAGTVTTNANLTGDVTSSGNATTLATVNSNVGSFTNANVTVNAKGLVTAASSGTASGATAGSPLFVQTASATAVTGSSETTILGSGVGSLTIPANWFTAAGTVLDVRFSGKYSTGAIPGTLQLKLKFGSTVIAQTTAFTPLVSVTDGVYTAYVRLIARTVGASGTIFVVDGLFQTGTTLTPAETPFTNPTLGTAVTIDTTATHVVDVTATWSSAATNSITGYTFEMVGPGSAVSSVFGRTGAIVATAGDYGPTLGGTGLTSYTQGDVLYSDASNSLAKLAKSTSADRVLCNTGTNNNPAWCQADLTKAVTGVLPTANGGARYIGTVLSSTTQTADFYTMPIAGTTTVTESVIDYVALTPTGGANLTCRNLVVNVNTAPGAGTSWAITMRQGTPGSLSNTTLTCTISGTATSCVDTSNSFTYTAGNVLTFFFDATGSVAGTAGHGVSYECYF